MYTGRMEVNIADFKARCLRLVAEVDRTGEEIVILKRGQPVARVVPAHDSSAKPWLALRGSGQFVGNAFEPVIAQADIEALQ
jgi:prevent-host-death family protein